MPELAEVAFHCSVWAKSVGETVDTVEANYRSRCLKGVAEGAIEKELPGRCLSSAFTHGKRMLFGFDDEVWLSVHLGMTGSLSRGDLDRKKARHDHLVIGMNAKALVFNDPRMFGDIGLDISERLPIWWTELPAEILSNNFNYERFASFLIRRKRSQAKSFLLRQDTFPGVGNWMADEILWKAEIDPRRRIGSLDQTERNILFEALLFVCRGAMDSVAVNYSDPPEDWLFRHRWKKGGACPKTGDSLVRETVGGRTTCWCPVCQR